MNLLKFVLNIKKRLKEQPLLDSNVYLLGATF